MNFDFTDIDEQIITAQDWWEICAAIHGHVCPGLAIGYRAALYARKLLNLPYADDEQTVVISENDACGVDAIQVILGCTMGKGNLLFHMRGKQAFSFYNRMTGKSVRLVLRPKPVKMTREQSLQYYLDSSDEQLFEVKQTVIPLPEPARIFDSYPCECCGEMTGSNWIRIMNGKKVCLDCYPQYDRFDVGIPQNAGTIGGAGTGSTITGKDEITITTVGSLFELSEETKRRLRGRLEDGDVYTGYRYSATGVFGYFYYKDREKICSSGCMSVPSPPVSINGFGKSWVSEYDQETTIIPGVTRSVVDKESGEKAAVFTFIGTGHYKLDNAIDIYCDENRYAVYRDNNLVLTIEHVRGDYDWIPEEVSYDVEPYFAVSAVRDISPDLLMLAVAFPLLRFCI